jgi:aminoglycoside 2'-N-acetyltransferase I
MPQPGRNSVFRTEDLTAALRRSIVDVCVAAHEEPSFEAMFTEFIPSGGRHFLVWRDDELVSHAVVTTRWLQPAGHALLRTAFVDAVSTRPGYQGMGYGTMVMRGVAVGIPDYEIACLQTYIPGFYERLGWQLWRGPLAGRTDEGLVPTPEQRGVMVLNLPRAPVLDLDAPLSIEHQGQRIWE